MTTVGLISKFLAGRVVGGGGELDVSAVFSAVKHGVIVGLVVSIASGGLKGKRKRARGRKRSEKEKEKEGKRQKEK